MFSDTASNISSSSLSENQFAVDESLDGNEMRYRENVSPKPQAPLKGLQTHKLHPKIEAENVEKEKRYHLFAEEEKELKKQREAQLERAKHQLLQRHPIIRVFDMEFVRQMVKKKNKDQMSLREETNPKKKASEEREHEETLHSLAKMDRYEEYAALQHPPLVQSVVGINQKLIGEKGQMRDEMKKLEREEREALMRNDKDALNHQETTAERRGEQQTLFRETILITTMEAKGEIERKRNDEHPAWMALEHLKDEMEKEAEEAKAYFEGMQIKEKRERPEKHALFESDKLHDTEESQQLETERHKARLYGDDKDDLAMERGEHTVKLIKTQKEASLKSSVPAEQLKEIKDYIRSKLTVARERGLDVEALLSLNVGNCGMFLNERPDIYAALPSEWESVTRRMPLPHYGTDDTRRVRHIQALNGFTVTLPNQNPVTLPPLKNRLTKIRLRDLLRDETSVPSVANSRDERMERTNMERT